MVGQLAVPGLELFASLTTHDGLEVPHHHGKGVWADHRANRVNGVDGVLQIDLEGAVHGLLQRGCAARDGHQIAAQNAHLGDVGVFLLDIHLAHVNLAGNAHQRTGRGQGYAMLAGAGLGNDFFLPMNLASSASPRQWLILCAPCDSDPRA